jgi:hypothetical protein
MHFPFQHVFGPLTEITYSHTFSFFQIYSNIIINLHLYLFRSLLQSSDTFKMLQCRRTMFATSLSISVSLEHKFSRGASALSLGT